VEPVKAEPIKVSPLEQIITSLKDRVSAAEVGTAAQEHAFTYRSLEKIASKMGGQVQTSVLGTHGLIVNLPDNVYPAGQFSVGTNVAANLQQVLEVLKPYEKEIYLTFIGHTDESPVAHPVDPLINTNLALSNLRASKAAEFAVKQGFDPKIVSTRGLAEFSRGTRSISIQITERSSVQ
jgi:flagellar motor protein MotB